MKEWKVFDTREDISRKDLTEVLNALDECGWYIQSITKEVYGIHYIYAWKKKRIDIEEPINIKHIEGLASKEY